MKKTKIVATISDLRCDVEFIRPLVEAGVNVVRMNTAHMTKEGITQVINNTRAVSPSVAVLLDTKGPEVRTTVLEGDAEVKREFHAGDKVIFQANPEAKTNNEVINVNYVNFVHDVPVGARILLDDGALAFDVEKKEGDKLFTVCQNNGKLGSRKSVNVPGVRIDLPSLTEKDRGNILHSIPQKIEFIAHSFVRNKKDIEEIQTILDEHKSDIKIIAKIENQEGVDNIDEIIDASYGIMIARGDLGIEVPIELIPGIQRSIINKCILKKKPVIVATQMLHTMICNPRPTRAEVTDIANAIYSHTDALMLSGETASGRYPVEAVQTMARIAEAAEQDAHKRGHITVPMTNPNDQREFLSRSAIEATEQLGVKGIITDSETGQTARNLAAFRGPNPVLAICYKEKVQRWLNMSYGVIAVYQQQHKSNEEMFTAALRMLRQKGYIDLDDKIAYLSGSFGNGGGTTFLEINKVSEVFDRSYRFHLPKEQDCMEVTGEAK